MNWKLYLALIGLSVQPLAVSSEQIVLKAPEFKLSAGSKPSYQVTRLTRNIDAAGAITRETSVMWIKRLGGKTQDWILPIEHQRASKISFMEVVKGQGDAAESSEAKRLAIALKGIDSETKTHFYQIDWPESADEETAVTIKFHFINLTKPKPTELRQTEGNKQGMYWEGDLLGGLGAIPGIFSETAELKVQVKCPTSRVLEKLPPSGFHVQQASGANIVIFTNKLSAPELLNERQYGYVLFYQPHPVMVIRNLTRLVEVSHWGNNVAIEDQIYLENRGPKLRGAFSRWVHQSSLHTRAPGATSHILTGLTLELPQGVSSPYYIDTIGNVSTSRFRPSTPPELLNPQKQSKFKKYKEAKFSKLELSPRYPIAGGWNYSFVIGYNLEAGRLLKKTAKDEYVLKIPFFTNAVDVPIELGTLRVRLPEGSSQVKVFAPFPTTETQTDLIDKTYLDTTGRPTVFIKKLACTEKHAGDVYITYTRSPMRGLQKPMAISGWMMLLFMLTAGLRRFQWKIGY
ncbi:hypothetical protein O181_067321 [Austropuccinia psidii MF-1]|uniref:Dolichyl-diphosphooligosaccharide--protein glycosyltransferase subunit 1 n=1 Tax=Austropuccinia psidii MF-1 TaxID=1389203 RepID=A0A9Q3I2Y4_9BASI|nr:hypothetical protein [Austropuccinia psidii MF-1]